MLSIYIIQLLNCLYTKLITKPIIVVINYKLFIR